MNKPNRWFGDFALRPEDIYALPAPAPTPDHRFTRKPGEKPTQERKPGGKARRALERARRVKA